MAFLIGSDRIRTSDRAQQLPSAAVGASGCWLEAGPHNKKPIYIASSEGGTYSDKTIDSTLGRITLLPGQRTGRFSPSNLDEIWVMGLEKDSISWAVS